MENMPLLYNNNNIDNTQPKRRCSSFDVVDKSEYIVVPSILLSLGCFAVSLANDSSVAITATTGIVTVSGMVAEWRIRALGIAKKLMDSVHDIKGENEKLKDSVYDIKEENEKLKATNMLIEDELGKFESEVGKLENIVGLMGDNVGDIEAAKTQLFGLYQKYKTENDKQESNNLLTLFGLVDKDKDSRLSKSEIKRMEEYIKIVYKEDFNFNTLDSDEDGFISLSEFFEKFRNRFHEPERYVVPPDILIEIHD